MSDYLEIGLTDQMPYIIFTARIKIIQTNHIVPFTDKPIAEMGANKTGSSGYQNTFHITYTNGVN